MKRITIILAAVLLTASAFAQAPQKMTYQAVVRNSSNALVQSSPVGMKVTILQGSVTGTAVYVETQTTQTNQNGLLDIVIGGGTIVSGYYVDSIFWGGGPYFLKTEIDPNGGTNYSITMTSELLSVPYSNYAHIAGTADSKSGVANPGVGSWGNFTILHNRNKRPKKITMKYVTTLNVSPLNGVSDVICESEWYDDDRDGLGNLYYHVPFNNYSITTDVINIVSNTNMLGRLCLTPNSYPPVLPLFMQEVTISSTLNDITILIGQPVTVTSGSNTYTLVGPWKVLYNIEW